MSAIEKEFLSKFIDNDEEINNMFGKDDNNNTNNANSIIYNNLNKSRLDEIKQCERKKNLSIISEKQNVHNFSMNGATEQNKDINNQQFERRMSQSSIKGKEIITSPGVRSII